MDSLIPFVPGTYWNIDRAAASHQQMVALRNSPEMQAMMQAVAAATEEAGDPGAASAILATSAVAPTATTRPPDRDSCIFRRGRSTDVPALVPLILSGELPPIFLEPYIEGFLVIEYDGRLIGCGGVEFYGPDAVIRSVVVDAAARGLTLGLDIGRLLEEDARQSGASDIYLFTLHAREFWRRLGYRDLPLGEWPAHVRENWQYQFVSQFPEAAKEVRPMVKRR
jgi:amino-acid N-acetyltransferase